jgi:hypothetical protein
MSESQMKTMLITFFDIKSPVHFEFIPQDETVNQACYVEILKQLHRTVFRKRHELWPSNWILHCDNAAAHKALSVKQFLARNSITERGHPSFSPYLALNVFWLFPKIKSALKGRRFQNIGDIKNVMTVLEAIQQQEFQKCFQQWQHC